MNSTVDEGFRDNLLQISQGHLDVFERTTNEFLADIARPGDVPSDTTQHEYATFTEAG